MITHGFASDEKDAAMKSVNAGVDIEMVSTTFIDYLETLIKNDQVKESAIDEAVRNILRLKFRLGLFDNPFTNKDRQSIIYDPYHLEVAKQLAVESAILLKNENNILPLNDDIRTIAIIGPLANAPHDQLGTWVFDGEKEFTQTPLKSITAMYGDKFKIIYEPGLNYSRESNTLSINKAVQAASNTDVILAFIGEESILSGEAHCLANLNLQGDQTILIEG